MTTTFQSLASFIKHLTAPAPIAAQDSGPVRHLPEQTGVVFETNEETYDYFLDALPPHFMSGSLFCFAEGFTPHTMFFRRGRKYFVRQLTEAETTEFCRLAAIPFPGHW